MTKTTNHNTASKPAARKKIIKSNKKNAAIKPRASILLEAKRNSSKKTPKPPHSPTTAKVVSVDDLLAVALVELKRASSKTVRSGMQRFNIPNEKALGVRMADIQKLGKQLGRNHALAEALWQSDIYEARMLSAYVDEPESVSSAQMNRWVKDFDNWAICDTLCFALWVRTPLAWQKAEQWSRHKSEFVKRAGFALYWSLSVHDKLAGDEKFLLALNVIERQAADERHFVKKAINMALRAIGKRNKILNKAATVVAARLSESSDDNANWVGKHALRELTSAVVKKRVANK